MASALTPLVLAAALLAGHASPQGMAVPAYFSPGSYWPQMDKAHPPLQIVVMNPANGPGAKRNPSYAAAVHAAESAGVTVLGYVYTQYAKRSLPAVEADVDAYYRWYHVGGIFFDQATTSCTHEPYYASLNTFVKAEDGPAKTVLNPGTRTRRCYAKAADILLTFEGSYSSYVSSYSQPKWVSGYPASRFWHVIHATPDTAALVRAIALSEQRHAGYVYATPLDLPNPYRALPGGSFWSAELSDLSR